MQPSPKSDPLLNTVLLGTYRVERLLGRGGMGSVYAATHVHLQTSCAIKVLLHEYTDRAEPLKRFQREAQITSQLGHPNIVRVTDFNFTPDGAPFMVMELLTGETLHKRLKGRGRMSLADVVLMFGPLCDALGLAHSRGVIHRDLKPDNIFLPGEAGLEGAKILDFGISKIRDGNTVLTQADVQMGTQSYMAPEIVKGAAAEADARSDVFSLGAILYEALTGTMAFDGPNAMAVMYKLVYQPTPSIRAIDPSLPEQVDAVLMRAMAQSAEARTKSAPELFSELCAAATPFLPTAEEMEARRSTPYRFTQTAMKAVRTTGSLPAAPSGPPSTPGQSTQAAAQPTRISFNSAVPTPQPGPVEGEGAGGGALPLGEIPEERPDRRKEKSGGLVMAIIAGLVVLTGVGLLMLRRHMLAPAAPAIAQPAAAPAAAPVSPGPVPQRPAPAEAAALGERPQAAPGATEPAKAEAAPDGEEAARKETGKKHHHRQRSLPRLELPKPPPE